MRPVLPDCIQDVGQLEDWLSRPTDQVVDLFRRLAGDVVLLGVAGKIGPSLAWMIRRAADQAGTPRRVIGVARFTSGLQETWLRARDLETIRCDLLDEAAVAGLPEAPLVVYLAGVKFGTGEQAARTWALNAYLPGVVCRRYRQSRIIAYSTGNVYPFVGIESGGASETEPPDPVGEYGMSCLGRERVFEHFSRAFSIPLALIRLNYACDLRYGVLVDLARKVAAGEPIDLSTGAFNTIWQGDAHAWALRALDHVAVPPFILNVTGQETLSVRESATRFGKLLGREPVFVGHEQPTALLANAGLAQRLCGPPQITTERLVAWVADWVRRGGEHLGKPTHFEVRDGRF